MKIMDKSANSQGLYRQPPRIENAWRNLSSQISWQSKHSYFPMTGAIGRGNFTLQLNDGLSSSPIGGKTCAAVNLPLASGLCRHRRDTSANERETRGRSQDLRTKISLIRNRIADLKRLSEARTKNVCVRSRTFSTKLH